MRRQCSIYFEKGTSIEKSQSQWKLLKGHQSLDHIQQRPLPLYISRHDTLLMCIVRACVFAASVLFFETIIYLLILASCTVSGQEKDEAGDQFFFFE